MFASIETCRKRLNLTKNAFPFQHLKQTEVYPIYIRRYPFQHVSSLHNQHIRLDQTKPCGVSFSLSFALVF